MSFTHDITDQIRLIRPAGWCTAPQNAAMDATEALGHLANFVWPALGTAILAASVAKFVWRRELQRAPWWQMTAAAAMAGLAALLAGLFVLGEDGRMATYGLLVLAETAALGWWVARPQPVKAGRRGS